MKNLNFEKPVCRLSGMEFLPKQGVTFAEQILEYFNSQGGKVLRRSGDIQPYPEKVVFARNVFNRKNPGDCCI